MLLDLNKQTFKDVLRISNIIKLHPQLVVEQLLIEYFEQYSDEELISIIKEGDTLWIWMKNY